MKVGSVCVNRNDGYKDNERGIIHFRSCLETFDEVNYVDWNSPQGSFLWEIKNELPNTGKIKHFVIPKEIVSQIIREPRAQKCNEGLSRNIAICRSDADWIVSTNIDIIPPTREQMLELVNKLDKDTFYTISRRELSKDLILEFGKENIGGLITKAQETIGPRIFPAKVTPNDNFSLINCCGDFQIAHRDVWNKLMGFEEKMIYACFVDTNIQKKAILNGLKLEVLYEPPLFHMEHGAYYTKEDGSRVLDPENKGSYTGDTMAYNDAWDWVEFFNETQNTKDWGLGNIEIEYEIF